jgi:hypothetical protein
MDVERFGKTTLSLYPKLLVFRPLFVLVSHSKFELFVVMDEHKIQGGKVTFFSPLIIPVSLFDLIERWSRNFPSFFPPSGLLYRIDILSLSLSVRDPYGFARFEFVYSVGESCFSSFVSPLLSHVFSLINARSMHELQGTHPLTLRNGTWKETDPKVETLSSGKNSIKVHLLVNHSSSFHM